ncbi:hypothetical protein VP01_1085g3 [Puccinia sorghi]|uniref:Uncharacterized protein n=1 Tax=Puccinia sorghi TaxID=27349 RepID=A0A0L6VT93_9BASI|nr:hypothetical protein VP01_1085g3 [Puccinia sorghi]
MASTSTQPSAHPPLQTDIGPEFQPKKNSTSGTRTSLSNSDFLANMPPPQHPSSQRASLARAGRVGSPSSGPDFRNDAGINRPSSSSSSSNNWTATVAATKGPLPSVLFAIPFPEPGPTLRKTSKTPMFMLYSPPRANYIKPKPIKGQKGKEGLIKKVERKWQEEVQEGTDVMAGKIENPSGWKKFKGTVLTVSVSCGWCYSSLEGTNMVARQQHPNAWPSTPRQKDRFGELLHHLDITPLLSRKLTFRCSLYFQDYRCLSTRRRRSHFQTCRSTTTRCQRRPRKYPQAYSSHGHVENWIVWAPVTRHSSNVSSIFHFTIISCDVMCIVPLFLFEINIVYFSLQINGESCQRARKIAMLTHANSKAKKHTVKKAVGTKSGRFVKLKQKYGRGKRQQTLEAETEDEPVPHPSSPPLPGEESGHGEIFNIQKSRPNVFQPVMANLYALCSAANPTAFPPKPKGSLVPPYRPDLPLVLDLIAAFKEWVPADVALRHNLDPQVVAKDLRQSMKKATKSYMRTLKSVK